MRTSPHYIAQQQSQAIDHDEAEAGKLDVILRTALRDIGNLRFDLDFPIKGYDQSDVVAFLRDVLPMPMHEFSRRLVAEARQRTADGESV